MLPHFTHLKRSNSYQALWSFCKVCYSKPDYNTGLCPICKHELSRENCINILVTDPNKTELEMQEKHKKYLRYLKLERILKCKH